MSARTLTLYSREGCHLCEEMRAELEPWRERLGFRLEVVDVDADPSLAARLGHKVPVLAEGESEICHHFLDEDALRSALGIAPGAAPAVELSVPDYVVIVVEDVGRALDFYTRVLGLELGHRSGPFAQLSTGSTRVALYAREAMAATLGFPIAPADPYAPGFELGFKVADVDAAYAELLARGARSATPPTDRPWGQRTAYVRDPDGHLIELAEDRRGRRSGP